MAITKVKDSVSALTGAGVSYLPAGTGAATDRTVQDKLRESVSVLDFWRCW
jgi:hypothetical protein